VSSDVDFVVTSVPATGDVEEILKGQGGIFENAKKGTFILDTSTISPIASKEFAAEAKKKEMVFIDTPMSGGITGATAGTLTFMVGCEKEHFEIAKEVLLGMGKNIFHCGGPGTGEIAKICNNLILGINMIATSEGISLGEKLGMDPKVLSKILSVSTGRSWCVDTYNPRPGVLENVPSARDYNGGFGVSLIRKDLSIALQAAKQADAKLKFTQMAIDQYINLEKKGCGKKDFGIVYRYIHNNDV
jgi:3-hydroxyisobutyrate dehydrogenase